MKTIKQRKNYLVIDERLNGIDYIEKTEFFIRNIESDVYSYKWLFISLHGALYSFAISACRGSNNNLVVEGNGKLISIGKALSYCKDPKIMTKYIFSKHLELTELQQVAIDWLIKGFRNNFQHFKPMGWSINLYSIPNLIFEVLNVVRFLAIDTGNIIFTNNQRRKIKSHIFQSKKLLKNNKYYIIDLKLKDLQKI